MHADPRLETDSARPDELVLMLFEGAARFGRQAVAAYDAGRDAEASVDRVRAILQELDRNLDRRAGTIGRHLGAIYDYLLRRLAGPEVGRDAMSEVVSDIETLAQTWSVLVERRDAELAAA